jgi:hypothetical protein
MSTDFESEVDELLRQSYRQGAGPAKIALVEGAVRLADAHQRTDLGFATRKELIRAATLCGSPEKAMVAFTWCLGWCDREPERFSEDDILWQYKWIMGNVSEFPQVTREQIDGMAEDMTQRYQRCGRGMRAVHKLRCLIAMDMERHDDARTFQRLWRAAPVERGNDCNACERHHQVSYLLFAGRDERALELAAPIVAGRLRCSEIPHTTLPRLLLPLMSLGRVEEAMNHHLAGYRMVSDNPEFLTSAARHLRFLVLTLNLPRAVQLFEKHLPWAVETLAPLRRFSFYVAVKLLLEVLSETRHETIAVRLPKCVPVSSEERSIRVADLAAYFNDECRVLAERFDARNGNDEFTRRLDHTTEWKKLIIPHPLPR